MHDWDDVLSFWFPEGMALDVMQIDIAESGSAQ